MQRSGRKYEQVAARAKAAPRKKVRRAAGERAESTDLGGALVCSPDPGVFLDRSLICRVATPAFETELAIDPAFILGKPLQELVHPEDASRVLIAIKGLTRGGTSARLALRLLGPVERVIEVDGAFSAPAGSDGYVCTLRPSAAADGSRLVGLIDRLPDLICTWTPDCRLSHVNEAYCRYFGRTRESLIGSTFWDLIPASSHASVRSVLATLSPANPSFTIEHEVFGPGGEIRWQQWTDAAVFDDSGDPLYFEAVGRDITDRKRAEEQLRGTERLARAVIEVLPGRLVVLDASGRVVMHNNEWKQTAIQLGIPEEILRPGCCYRAVCERAIAMGLGQADQVLDAVQEVLAGDSPYIEFEYEFEILGESCWSLCRIVRFGAPGAEQVLVAHIDLTAHRQLERDLRRSEEQYRRIVDTAEEGIWVIDQDARTSFVNARMAEMLGYRPEEMLGRCMTDFMDDAAKSQTAAALDLACESARERHELRFRHRSGRDVWTLCSVSPMKSADSRFIGALGMITDITSRRRAEEQARTLQNEIAHVSRHAVAGEMAAEIAHEINQPLAAIGAYTRSALRYLDGRAGIAGVIPEAALDALRKADEQASRAGEVIRHLVQFFRKGESERQPTDAGELLREVESLARVSAGAFGTGVRFEVEAGVPRVVADRIQVQQVLLNLVRNAAESTLAAGRAGSAEATIVVRASRSVPGAAAGGGGGGGGVLFSVRDRGQGFAGVDHARLFQPFYTTKRSGMGLGLAISKTIVESHAGRLWAEDDPAGGAVFHFTIPAVVESVVHEDRQ